MTCSSAHLVHFCVDEPVDTDKRCRPTKQLQPVRENTNCYFVCSARSAMHDGIYCPVSDHTCTLLFHDALWDTMSALYIMYSMSSMSWPLAIGGGGVNFNVLP